MVIFYTSTLFLCLCLNFSGQGVVPTIIKLSGIKTKGWGPSEKITSIATIDPFRTSIMVEGERWRNALICCYNGRLMGVTGCHKKPLKLPPLPGAKGKVCISATLLSCHIMNEAKCASVFRGVTYQAS